MKNLISSNFFAKHLASSRGGYSHKTTASTQPPTSVANRLLIGCSSVADRFLTMTSLCHRLVAAILLLFTLSIGNVWGAEIKLVSVGTVATQSSPDFFDNKTYSSIGNTYSVNLSTNGTSKAQGGSYGSPSVKDYYYALGSACDMSGTPSNYFKVSATGCKISKIVVRLHDNSTSRAIFPAMGCVNVLPATSSKSSKNGRVADVIIDNQTPGSYTVKNFENASTLTYEFTTNVSEVYFSKQIKKIGLSTASAWSNYPSSSAQSVCLYGIDVYVVPSCQNVSAPTSLSCTAHTESSLTFGWTNASNNAGYIVKLWNNSTCTGDPVASDANVATNSNSKTFTGLDASTTYYCKVQSKGDGSTYCAEGGITDAANGSTDASSCAATAPGAISKGDPSGGTGIITLTSAGSAASGDTWYWQDAEDGTATDKGSGATKNVSATGTYYIRSYNDAGSCWSTAKSITVAAADLLTPITPSLSYNAMIVVGATASPTLAGNDGSGSVSYALNDVTPAGCMTIDGAGVVTAVAAGTATVTATIAQSGYYAGNTATSGTIKVVPAPTHLVENVLATSGSWDSYILTTDNSHISNLAAWQAAPGKTLIQSGKESASNSRTPGITSNSSSTLVESDYVYLQFDIQEGYELAVSDISVKVFSISNSGKYVARISDNNSTPNVIETAELTVNSSTDGTLFSGYDFSSSPKLSGTVTLKLFAYGWSNGYRMKSPVYIDGTITEKKVVKTTVIELTDVKVNDVSISEANLTTLKTEPAYSVTLTDEYASAPTVKFNKCTTVTYMDDSQNVTNEVLSVTASNVSDEWKAQQEINSITYTVKAGIATIYTVNYVDEDGSTPLGSEPVAVGSHPTAAGITAEKDWHTLEGWKLNSVLTALTDVSAGAGETVTLVASFTPSYATSINIEQWILNNKKGNAAFRAVLDAQYFKYADLNDLDSLTAAKNETDRNEPYLGQKWKKTSSYISFLLKSGSTVRAKFGYVGSNVNVIIGDADPVAKTASDLASPYEYENTSGADVIVKFQGTGTNTVVIKQIMIDEAIATVKLHAIVTYDANGGSFGKSSEKYTGTPLVIADATPADPSGYDFEGWHVGTVDGDLIDASAYEPTKNVTLVANYEAKPSPFSLSTLTYQIGAGAATAVGYVEGTYEYTVQLPYAHSYDAITVAATLQDATSSLKAAISQPAGVPGDATFTVVADDLSEQAYTIHFVKAPKDGVCLIKANVGNDSFTIDEEASMLSGSTEKNAVKSSSQRYPDEESGLTGWKFNSKGAYLGLVLSGDDKFLAGDVVKAYVTKVADDGVNKKLYVFSNKTTDNLNSVLLASSTDDVAQGLNSVTLPALTEVNKLYLCRGTDGNDYQNYNPYIAYVAVYRPMNPVLKSMTIDGRTVTINEAAKTATCTIPYASDLAALTIVDEVVWNAAAATDAKVVTSNSGNWVIGDNTLKLTDKDGDYTIYTITLSRDVLKHTVSFNTHGGSAVASEEVVHNGYLASAPADPTKEDYLFQYWSLSDGGSEVDVTTIQVDEDKTFHAVWAPDGAIKLLNGSTVNTTDFITGVTATETVEFKGNTVNYAKFAGTVSSVSGVKDLTRVIAYNATTTQTKIQISAHNNSTSARSILVKGVVEGSTAVTDLATIDLGNKEDKVSDWITFNNAANRTIYIFVGSSAGDVYFTQVKVIESGTALKTAGQAGYSINFNQGRPFGVKEVDHVFEGLTFQVSSDYQPVNSSYTVAKFKSSSAHVTVASPVTMTVTTANNKTYYVGTSSSATTNETAKTGASEFSLTAGTWYINAGASEVQITNIAFSAPKCAEPVISSLANSDVCDGAGYEALDGTATAADGGTFAYQWYSCDDAVKTNPVELTGEDDATYTPSADGFYYVVVTHSLTDYADNVKASDAVKVTTHAGTEIVTPLARVRKTAGADATLTVEATGKNLHYAWKECETIDGSYTDVAGAADNKSLNITVPDGVKYYKVIVTSDCGAAQESIAKVEKFVPVPQATVSTSTTWDFTTCADAEIKLTDGTSPKKGEECLMANIEGVHMDENFHSESLVMSGEYIYRNVTGKPTCAEYMKFITDVEGVVTVTFSGNGSNRLIRVTDANSVQYSTVSSGTGDVHTEEFFVVPGEVELMGMNEAKTETKKYMRFFQIEFFPYHHRRSGVIGNLGTICWPYNVPVANRKGADFFSIDYFNSSHIIFIEEDGELQAGRPYFFQYTEENMLIQNGETHVDDPSDFRGMYGTFTNIDDAQGKVMLKNNNLYYAPAGSRLGAYRAYIQWEDVEALTPYVEPAGAPLRRRMYINMEHKTPTDLENIDVLNNLDGNKFIKDGKLYILRNGHLYNAQGVRVQ